MQSISDCCNSDWTRITVLLPVNTQPERNACASCWADLHALCNVVTYNSDPTIFVKYYKVTDPNIPAAWLFDDICIVSGDINLSITDPVLPSCLLVFEMAARNYYEHEGSPQGEIWITASVIHKLSSVTSREDAIAGLARGS